MREEIVVVRVKYGDNGFVEKVEVLETKKMYPVNTDRFYEFFSERAEQKEIIHVK